MNAATALLLELRANGFAVAVVEVDGDRVRLDGVVDLRAESSRRPAQAPERRGVDGLLATFGGDTYQQLVAAETTAPRPRGGEPGAMAVVAEED
jgi:hypothetical protein